MEKINMPNSILNSLHYVVKQATKKYYKDGIELEKGALITEQRIKDNRELYEQICNYWICYPDCFIDLITPSYSHFKLFFYQRIFLRAILRHGRICTIAPRAFSKSFISILGMFLMCIFRPGIKVFICAPGKAQSAKIAKEKLFEIYDIFPLLKKELIGDGAYGVDYVSLSFRNGSKFDVVSPLGSQRGGRRGGGIIDEFRDHVPDDINSIVLPLLNVSRKMANGLLNENEPHQVQIWITSASDKNSYAYDKTIELLEMAIINPNKFFIMGCDYRLPVECGLLPPDFINELKASQTFNEADFAREYMSRFVGMSSDSWFNYERIMAHRKIVNPENQARFSENADYFYVLSVDVARRGCQTVCTALKVYPKDDGNFKIKLVNLYVLGKTENEKVLGKQVIELKKLIKQFNPRQVALDINGLGIFMADEMIKPTYDYATGITYPAYGFINRDEYLKIQPKDAPKILFGIKATVQINSEMHSKLYAKIDTGRMDFLITEKSAYEKIMATKTGQRMKIEDRSQRLVPHQLTSYLIDELMNLRTKPAGANNLIAVEPINKRMTKDKFSSLEMGVYVISLMEQEQTSRRRNRGLERRQLTFYRTGGGQ